MLTYCRGQIDVDRKISVRGGIKSLLQVSIDLFDLCSTKLLLDFGAETQGCDLNHAVQSGQKGIVHEVVKKNPAVLDRVPVEMMIALNDYNLLKRTIQTRRVALNSKAIIWTVKEGNDESLRCLQECMQSNHFDEALIWLCADVNLWQRLEPIRKKCLSMVTTTCCNEDAKASAKKLLFKLMPNNDITERLWVDLCTP